MVARVVKLRNRTTLLFQFCKIFHLFLFFVEFSHFLVNTLKPNVRFIRNFLFLLPFWWEIKPTAWHSLAHLRAALFTKLRAERFRPLRYMPLPRAWMFEVYMELNLRRQTKL